MLTSLPLCLFLYVHFYFHITHNIIINLSLFLPMPLKPFHQLIILSNWPLPTKYQWVAALLDAQCKDLPNERTFVKTPILNRFHSFWLPEVQKRSFDPNLLMSISAMISLPTRFAYYATMIMLLQITIIPLYLWFELFGTCLPTLQTSPRSLTIKPYSLRHHHSNFILW